MAPILSHDTQPVAYSLTAAPPLRPPGKAYSLIQKHGCLEDVISSLDTAKYPIPDPYPYQEAGRLFKGAGGGYKVREERSVLDCLPYQ